MHGSQSMTVLQGSPVQAWTPQSGVASNAVLGSEPMCAEVPLHVEPLLAHKMQSLLNKAPQMLQPGTPARPAPNASRLAFHLMAAVIPDKPCGHNSSKAAAADVLHSNRACHASAMQRANPDLARQPATVIGSGSAAFAAPGPPESLPSRLFSACNSLNVSGHHDSIDVQHIVGSLAVAGSRRVSKQAPTCQMQTLSKLLPACTTSQGLQTRRAQTPSADQPLSQALPALAHSATEADEQFGQHDAAATPPWKAASATFASGQIAPHKSLHGGVSAPRQALGAQKRAGTGVTSQGPSTPKPLLKGWQGTGPTAEAQQMERSTKILLQAGEGSKQGDGAHQAWQGVGRPAQAEQGGGREGGECAERPSEDLARAEASGVYTALQTVQV